MKKVSAIILVLLLLALGISMSGCSMFGGDTSSQHEPETVIVTETVYVTEPASSQPETTVEGTTQEDTIQSETTDTTQQVSEKKGYTTEETLKKAEESSENQYWIVFFGEGRLKMATFNALEGFKVVWKSDGELVCDKLMGSSIVKYWDSNENTFTKETDRTDIAFRASDIVGSNCDIYVEKNNTVIEAKTK